MKLIALKTDNGRITGKIAFYCKALGVSRQRFYEYLKNKDKPWKYTRLAAKMIEIREEDEYNEIYERSNNSFGSWKSVYQRDNLRLTMLLDKWKYSQRRPSLRSIKT